MAQNDRALICVILNEVKNPQEKSVFTNKNSNLENIKE